jgi:hypothetical protein
MFAPAASYARRHRASMSREASVSVAVAAMPRRAARALTSLVEVALVAVVVAWLVPHYGALAERPDGRDARYAQATAPTGAAVAPANIAKDDAMRALLVDARWQFAGYAALGLALLHLKRLGLSPIAGTALALGAWGAAGWLGRVPWPQASLALMGVSLPLLVASVWLSRRLPGSRSRAASAVAYPAFVAATGIGWLVLLDLSANGLAANRYLALYHHGHLWLAMLVFGVVSFWREPIGRALAWTLAFVDGLASRVAARLGAVTAGLAFAAIVSALVVAVAVPLAHLRQLTSELGRLWLIVGGAWFFFLRGTPLTERLARRGSTFGSLLRYLAPLAFVVVVLVAAMLATRDPRPAARRRLRRRGVRGRVGRDVALPAARGRRGGRDARRRAVRRMDRRDDRGAVRVRVARHGHRGAARERGVAARRRRTTSSRSSPGSSARRLPRASARARCRGAASARRAAARAFPRRSRATTRSPALVGEFGWTGAWIVTLGIVLWLHAVVRAQGRRDARRAAARPGGHKSGRAVAQRRAGVARLDLGRMGRVDAVPARVTVAGNLAVIPLTGVTFPFVSFGMTSLVVNAAMLALAASVVDRAEAP